MPDLIEFIPFSNKEVQYRKEITNLRKQVSDQSRKITSLLQTDHEQDKTALRRRIRELEEGYAATSRKLQEVLDAQLPAAPKVNRPKRSKQPTPVVQKERLL